MIIPASHFEFGKIEIPTLWNNVKTIEFHKAIRAFRINRVIIIPLIKSVLLHLRQASSHENISRSLLGFT